jgi:hypothetical protein
MTDLPTAPDSVRRIGRPAHRSWSKVALTGGLALAVGLLAACGASSASGSAVAAPNESAAAPSSGQPNQSGQANPSGQGGPGRAARSAASGTIAAASPGTIQVQATSSQTTVNYTDSTTITESVVADLSAVTVGSCITAAAIPAGGVGRNGAASGSAAPTTTAAPPPSAAANGPFTATIVQLRDAVNGACTGGFGAGGFGGGPGGTPPSGAVPDAGALPGGGVPPSGGALPSGAPGAGGPGGFGQRASGTVANVAGDVITVTVTDPSTSATSTQTVNVTASTMYTKTQSAASDALVVGKCAVVQGSADAKGAVAATSIAVSTPAAGATCNAEFAGGRTRGGQGGNGRGGQGGNGPGVGAAPSTTTGG